MRSKSAAQAQAEAIVGVLTEATGPDGGAGTGRTEAGAPGAAHPVDQVPLLSSAKYKNKIKKCATKKPDRLVTVEDTPKT